MVRRPSDLPATVVLSNPDEDCSAETLRDWIEDVLAGPEPQIESIGAAEAIRELRDAEG